MPEFSDDEFYPDAPTCEGTGVLPCTRVHSYCGGNNPDCDAVECEGCADCEPDEGP